MQVPIAGDRRHNISGIVSVISYIIGIISENRRVDLMKAIDNLLNQERSQAAKDIIELCTGFIKK
jgi:hypothetical protein